MKKYLMINKYEKYVASIKEDIRNGKNICIVSLCKSFALDLRDKLRRDFPEIADAIDCFSSESGTQLKKELDDIRKNWKKSELKKLAIIFIKGECSIILIGGWIKRHHG